ncbi:MAG: dihydrolipoyl dehydrogenase [Thaumarchaeota archaeon]|nr:dihydrolipoyl dehydrogenase [Nitrososphaerota archaeon]
MQRFDLIVIGAGSGLDVANGLAEQGFKVAIIEKGPLGGTCLNRGCIPSKMLIHSADVVETLKSAHLFGVKVDGFSIDFASIVKRVSDSVDKDSKAIEEALKHVQNPKLFKEECIFIGHKTLQVGEETLQADKILIASGGRPRIPNIEGLKESGFITSEEALRLKIQPKVLTILGGGYIAAELAHFFGALGTEINIVQRHPILIPNEDEEVAKAFTQIFSKRYNVLTGYEPVKVSRQGENYQVTVKSVNGNQNKSKTLTSDQLLVATGITPNSDILDVQKTGVKTNEKGYVQTDEYLETNVKGIFALGDAVGHYLFKHSANLEAEYNFYNMLDPENRTPVDYTAMPHAIFTYPQIAGVGKTEQQLRAENADYAVGRYNYIDTGMGQAIEDQTGFVKILLNRKTGRILGCHIMGTDAPTLIHEVLVAMKTGDGSVKNITRVVHIHPALSEVVDRAAANIQ